jgi:Na+/H+-dicarboxylate symporter
MQRQYPRVTATQVFWLAFGAALAALAAAVVTGRRRQRRLHLCVAPAAVVLLALAIVAAERLGRARSFPPAAMDVHLIFAKTAACLVLPVIASGLLLARARGGRERTWRRVHVACVCVFLVGTATATATGVWVFSLSLPR